MKPISKFLEVVDINFSMPMIIILFTIFTLCWYTWLFYTKSMKNSNKLPPGPPGLPLIGNLASLDPDLHSYFAKLANKYGPIYKLHLGYKLLIVVTSPSIAKQILKDHDITFANRDVSALAAASSYGGSDIAWSPYGPEWRMLRKVCVLKMLSNTTLDSVYSLRRRELRQTVGYMYSQAGSPVNFGEQAFVTIMNVVTGMLWGGTVKGEERASVGAEFRKVAAEITELLGKPDISDLFPGLGRFDLQGLQKNMKRLAKQFDNLFERMIDKRLNINKDGEGDNESKDFLQFLLKLKDEEDPNTPLTMNHIKALLMDMIVGGTDTSSSVIEFTMAEIMNKPEVMRKAQEELDIIIGKNNRVEESHTKQLPYLNAVIKESLRLHSALPLLIPHSPSETCNIGGYTIPKGSRVLINVWQIHRDPSVWENPLEFKPERFLDDTWDYSGSDFSYFPFGSGRRICAGIAMAERMVLYSLATFLHSFDWKLLEGRKLDLSEKFGIVLKLKNPLIVIPTPRLSNLALYK